MLDLESLPAVSQLRARNIEIGEGGCKQPGLVSQGGVVNSKVDLKHAAPFWRWRAPKFSSQMPAVLKL